MAILEEEVWVGLGGANIRHFKNLDYKLPMHQDKHGKMKINIGEKILVKVSDLPKSSEVKITKVCDECGAKVYNQGFNSVMGKRKKNNGVDRCSKCGSKLRGMNRKNNVKYENSLECFVLNNKEFSYLLSEFSELNTKSPREISKSTADVYWWRCNVCDSLYDLDVSSRTNKRVNCPYCAGRRVNETNSLAIKNQEIAQLLTNQKEAYKVTSGSGKKLKFTCPDCGHINKKQVWDVVNLGLNCTKCGDGKPYPEKFVFSMLDQLNIDFIIQKTFEWSKNVKSSNEKLNGTKKYDFYIPSLNMIIETHGGQHYKDGFISLGGKPLTEVQDNDKLKEDLAKNNGIKKYIIIDTRDSSLEWIQNSIIESRLSSLLDMSKVNWLKCHEFACNSLVKVTCELWNSGVIRTEEIGKVLKISRQTAIKYLKLGAKIGWCNYEPVGLRRRVVQLNEDGNFIKEWESASKASKFLGSHQTNIFSVCNGTRNVACGYKWMYKEDYDKLIKELQVV